MNEQKTAAIGASIYDIQQEIGRLTASVAKLEGPPPAGGKRAEASHQNNLQPALLERGKMNAPDHPEWNTSAAQQLNIIADRLLRHVKAHGANPNDPLLPLAQAALDLSSDALKASTAQRAKVEELAKQAQIPDNRNMTDITREELSARLELVESKADARMSRFEERMDSAIGEMRRDRSEIKAAISNLKSTTIVTAISAVLAIVLGVAAFNSTVLSNMVASFESGKNTATAVIESTKRLELLQDRIEAQQKQPATKP